MEGAIENFVLALRRSGVNASTAETLDAVRAVERVGYSDREALRIALAATLAKSLDERILFDSCFERYFSAVSFSEGPPAGRPHISSRSTPAVSELARMLLSGDRAGLTVALGEAARTVELTGIRFFTQKGMYIQRILRQMGFDVLERDMKNIVSVEGGTEQFRSLRNAREEFYRTVRDYVERQLDLFAPQASANMMEDYFRNVRLSSVEQRDLQRMHAVVEIMARRLSALYSRKRKRSSRGQLDFKKTLRDNMAHRGLLFDTRWKAKKKDRPDVVAICDISRSVKNVTRFFLLFLYTLNEMLARIRTFVFCSNLAEVSGIFNEHGLERAVAAIESGNDFGVSFGLTDYGRSLVDFKQNHLGAVSQKTTVIIIGDARNNHDDPRAEILKEIHEKCKRLIWLNPEGRTLWGTGDSAMPCYLRFCSLAMECNTLSHLEKVARSLLKMSA